MESVETVRRLIPSGFTAWVVLWVWLGLILLHSLARSFFRPVPDPIRPSGPIDP